MIKKLNILFILLFFTSCACVLLVPPEFRSSQNYNKNFDIVWEEVIAILAEKNIPIKTIEKSSGIIVCEDMQVQFTGHRFNPFHNYDFKYCDCDKPGFLKVYREMVGQFSVFVRKIGNKETSVQINTNYKAAKYFNFINNFIGWTECTSNGFLEDEILTGLDHALSVRGGIGVTLTEDGTILSIVDGYPAKEAGLLIGDKIIEVNNLTMKDRQEIEDNLIGKPNTELELTLRRGKKKIDLILKRKILNLESNFL
jgi:hypothetical protein